LPTALEHPGSVWLGYDARDLNASRRQVDHEQDGEAGEPASGLHFDGEEVGRGEDAPVRPQEFLPRCSLPPSRRGINTVLFQDVRDGPRLTA
jgi:hypothetical protein